MVLKKLFGVSDNKSDNKAQVKENQPSSGVNQEKDSSEPPTAKYLEQAMVENIRQDGVETRNKVYQELLFSDLLLAIEEPKEEQKSNGEVAVTIMTNNAKVKFAAAFTSMAAAKRWRPEGGGYISIKGQDLFSMLEKSPAEVLVINPASAPFIELPKVEYKQLSMGVIPQSNRSPVQAAQGGQQGGQQQGGEQQPEIIFDPKAFPEKQANILQEVLEPLEKIDALAFAFMVPPGKNPETDKVRTAFVRTKDIELTEEAMTAFFEGIQADLKKHEEELKEAPFQFFPMPDTGFWVAVHRHNCVKFDKNKPEIPEEAQLRKDAFNENQLKIIKDITEKNEHIEAAAIGGILPPDADMQSGWVRTVFVRLKGIDLQDENKLTEYFEGLHKEVISHEEEFKEVAFTFRIMHDGGFWLQKEKADAILFDNNPPNEEVQMAFPPDVFTDKQKEIASQVMQQHEQIEAASVGAILPPGGDKETGWIRTIFIRAHGVSNDQNAMQEFCSKVRDGIVKEQEEFKETGFEVGIMPDPGFWQAMHENKFILFDKNPPEAGSKAEKEEVVEASLD